MSGKRKKGHPLLRLAVLVLAGWLILTFLPQLGAMRVAQLSLVEIPEWVDVQIIQVDGLSRRGEKLEDIRNIVIHYVGNPGTTAQQNHDWYENPQSEVSSHFLIGLEGEIIQCIPLDEFSSATNHRNKDTISVEVCHPDESGRFNDAAYSSLVRLTVWLLENTGLKPEDVIRHYDVTGKECPRYFVRNEDSWRLFLQDVDAALRKEG
ncbi:MAG: N-acetylmuramoyl-L-alanine amidase [Ruminococcaceae bacterium]|nr:N-acetylmuramoyl-L-alanine amidase [Oscillospiraceae bacterium]